MPQMRITKSRAAARQSRKPKHKVDKLRAIEEAALQPVRPTFFDTEAFHELPTGWKHTLEQSDFLVFCALDFGTTKAEATLQMSTQSAVLDLTDQDIQDLMLHDNCDRQIPTEIAVIPIIGEAQTSNARWTRSTSRKPDAGLEGEVISGPDVSTALKAGKIGLEDCFFNIKLSECLQREIDIEEDSSQHEAYTRRVEAHRKSLEHIKTKYQTVFVRDKWQDDRLQEVHIESMEDVLRLSFQIQLQALKLAIERDSCDSLPRYVIDQMFSSSRNYFSDRFRFALTIPELYTWQKHFLYKMLTDVGYPPQIEFLSEGRCTIATHLMLMTREDKKRRSSGPSEQTSNSVWIGIDLGGGTADISSMITVKDANGVTRLKSVGVSSSSPHGANNANEAFLSLIPTIFGSQLDTVLSAMGIDESALAAGLVRGFEYRKVRSQFDLRQQKAALEFHGPQQLPEGCCLNSGASWAGREVYVPMKYIRHCLETYLQDLFRNEPEAPFRSVLDAARKACKARGLQDVQVLLSGNGGKCKNTASFIKDIVKKQFGIVVSRESKTNRAWVAMGGCILMADPEICKGQKFSAYSVGIVIEDDFDPMDKVHLSRNPKGKLGDRLPNTVIHKQKMGEEITFASDERFLEHTILTGNDGRNHPSADIEPWEFCLDVVTSKHPQKAVEDGHEWNGRDFREVSNAITMVIDKRRASQISGKGARSNWGFEQNVDGKWMLRFCWKLAYQWNGMLVQFRVTIPIGGVFFDYKGNPIKKLQTIEATFPVKGEFQTMMERADALDDGIEVSPEVKSLQLVKSEAGYSLPKQSSSRRDSSMSEDSVVVLNVQEVKKAVDFKRETPVDPNVYLIDGLIQLTDDEE